MSLRQKFSKKLVFTLFTLLLVASGSFYFWQQKTKTVDDPISVVADPNFKDGTDRTQLQSVERNAGIKETSGEDVDTNQEALTSETGAISVVTPKNNQLVKPGDRLAGLSKLDRVYFRLIDDKIGVLTQGSLKVVDGKFSGIFEFQTDAAQGRLDIFNIIDGGVEADVIEIDITFK